VDFDFDVQRWFDGCPHILRLEKKHNAPVRLLRIPSFAASKSLGACFAAEPVLWHFDKKVYA
jgi:hypothetical protein